MKTLSLLFNINSHQINALSPYLLELSYPFKIESLFLVPKYLFTASLTPSLLPYCVPRVHEGGISVLGTDKSHKEPFQEYMGDEEGFQIHIQSQQSWQLVTCGQGSCPAKAEHKESVFLIAIMQFSGISTSIRLDHMNNCLSCDLAQDNQLLSPLDYPNRLRTSPSVLNEPS